MCGSKIVKDRGPGVIILAEIPVPQMFLCVVQNKLSWCVIVTCLRYLFQNISVWKEIRTDSNKMMIHMLTNQFSYVLYVGKLIS